MDNIKLNLSNLFVSFLTIRIDSLKSFLKYFFALITVHVLVVYYIKNLMGISINDPIYVMIKMWKEIVLCGFLAIYLIKYFSENKTIKIQLIDLSIAVFVLFGLIYIVVAPNKVTALWSFRSLFEIFGFYMLGRMFSLRIEQLNKFLYVLIIMGCVTSIFGVIQVQFLGADFFSEVYGVDKVAVAMTSFGYEKLRASSTFITPHEFGLYLILCFMFASYLYKMNKLTRQVFFLIISLLLVGLLFSLSRSSIVILIICSGLYWVNDLKKLFLFSIGCLFGAVVFVLMGAIENIVSVVQGTDPSSMGRFRVFDEFMLHLMEYPFGSGMGTVGVVVRRFIPTAPQFEGELFNLIAMTSVVGGIIYLSILVMVLFKLLKRNASSMFIPEQYLKMVGVIVIALLLRDLILPRDFTNYAIGWFLVGSTISFLRQFSSIRKDI